MQNSMSCPACLVEQFKFNRDRCMKEQKRDKWNKKMIEINITILENTPQKNKQIMCRLHWYQYEKYVSKDGTKMEIPVDPELNVNEAMEKIVEIRREEISEEHKEMERKFKEKFGEIL